MYVYRQYSSNQVIQEKKNFIVEGKTSGKDFKASLIRIKDNTKFDPINIDIKGGCFFTEFNKVDASFDKYELVFEDNENKVVLENIRFGDVFSFNGQSNVSYSLNAMPERYEYIDMIDDCDISILDIREGMIVDGSIYRPNHRLDETFFSWNRITKENIINLSALAVMVSVKMFKKLNKPIGAIMTAIGGCSIDTYLPYESCLENKKIHDYLVKTNRLAELDKFNMYGVINYTQTSGMYFEKIYPIRHLKHKCFIWYQGENSCWDYESARYYKEALKLLIKEMRKTFDDKNLPILISGIADEYYPYGDSYGYIYIQEVLSMIRSENIIYVPIHDIDNSWIDMSSNELFYHPIHPVTKEIVSTRFVSFIYNNIYLKKDYFSPYIESFYITRNNIILNIKYADKGLKTGSEYFGFTIASSDRKYHNAKAIAISESEIELSSASVSNPKYFAYGIMQYSMYLDCKTKDNLPLNISRSLFEDMKKSVYLFNSLPLSLKANKIIENNFGPSTGNILPIDIYENGDIIRERNTKIKLNKGILSLDLNPTRREYYFSSLRINVSLSGVPSNFDKYRYLMFRMKSNKDVSLEGMLVRYNGRIYRFPIAKDEGIATSEKLSEIYENYYIDLKKTLDGSDVLYDTSVKVLESISTIEVYFKSYEKSKVCISKIDLVDSKNEKLNKKIDDKKEEVDPSMFLNH